MKSCSCVTDDANPWVLHCYLQRLRVARTPPSVAVWSCLTRVSYCQARGTRPGWSAPHCWWPCWPQHYWLDAIRRAKPFWHMITSFRPTTINYGSSTERLYRGEWKWKRRENRKTERANTMRDLNDYHGPTRGTTYFKSDSLTYLLYGTYLKRNNLPYSFKFTRGTTLSQYLKKRLSFAI